MVSKTVFECISFLTADFEKADVKSPRTSAEMLIGFVLNKTRSSLFLDRDITVSDADFQKIISLAQRRKQHEPIQYIMGACEFYGLNFHVSPSVLIPRPETELLVEAVIEYVSGKSVPLEILDIGTGSGIIPITLAKHLRNVSLTASDISPKALTVAGQNAKMHEVEDRIEFLQSDIYLSFIQKKQKFDIIISNPPYINKTDMQNLDKEVVSFEPENALFGGDDGLDFYRQIIEGSCDYLTDDGMMFLEIGYDQGDALIDIAADSGLVLEKLIKDYNDFDRVLILKRKV